MAKVFVLQPPRNAAPFRLTLAGRTLVTDNDVDGSRTLQTFPNRGAVQEHVWRVLWLRRLEGYQIRAADGIAEDDEAQLADAVQLADPVAKHVRYRADCGSVQLDFDEHPIVPETFVEIIARIKTAAPTFLGFTRECDVGGSSLDAALVGTTLPSVKSLDFVAHSYGIFEPHVEVLDDLAGVIAALPSLERVRAIGKFLLSEGKHGCLRELYLEADPMLPATLTGLADGSLPALSTIVLSLGAKHTLDRAAGAALRSIAAPHLHTVYVAELTNVTRFLTELTERVLPASWAALHLDGLLGDEDELLRVLRERTQAFRSLKTLGLPLDLSESGVTEAQALLPCVMEISDLPDLTMPERCERR